MPNMLDYIAWRGDLGFESSALNEVDSLIFSELAYIKMDGIAPESDGETVTLRELERLYRAAGYDQSFLVNDPYHTLASAALSARFGGIRVGRYVNRVEHDSQVQFSAATFFLPGGDVFVAYRGTDNTTVGWREDFNMNFLSVTPGQAQAAEYLNAAFGAAKGGVYVGGHSKGGNFAVYAAAFANHPEKAERLRAVYSFDGPGFNRAVAEKEEYAAVLPKITKIVPESSIIGMLLITREPITPVKSEAKGIQQHNPYNWQLLGANFLRAEAVTGTFADEALKKWCDSLNENQWRCLCDAVFGALDASGATTLYEINSNKLTNYNAIARALFSTDKTVYKGFTEAVKLLAVSGKDAVIDSTRRKLEHSEKRR